MWAESDFNNIPTFTNTVLKRSFCHICECFHKYSFAHGPDLKHHKVVIAFSVQKNLIYRRIRLEVTWK